MNKVCYGGLRAIVATLFRFGQVVASLFIILPGACTLARKTGMLEILEANARIRLYWRNGKLAGFTGRSLGFVPVTWIQRGSVWDMAPLWNLNDAVSKYGCYLEISRSYSRSLL